MVSIEYGGGPTLEQRREFCNLEEGGHIPGYMGFCPQLNYQCGNSYGKTTAEIAANLSYYNGPQTQKPHHLRPTVSDDKNASVRSVFRDEVPGRMLPESTGDNKYIAGMIPGYSGDVPHLAFKFGTTYRETTDECVDEFVREYKCHEAKREELREISGLFPTLRAVSNDPRVRNHMNIWSDELRKNNATVRPIRGPTDPPIPGYQGFIPRMQTTEAGLAKRYHEGAHQSLEAFRAQTQGHFDRLAQPITSIDTSPVVDSKSPQIPSDKYVSSRIFRKEGMIPDYNGHVHGLKFQVGKNFGNITRDLEVCAHPFPSYGDYVREKDLASKYVRQ
ncbi:hypothetical protein FGIG_08686 [Fasciola gigantica]|uniref:Protein FAM166B n=1 Tax=Fasciola gigantica TaxID=46835 RepID=A0A504YZT8_FASGI|nr:hypothetical protein FGIG_08686 [Fasciola gigantica]